MINPSDIEMVDTPEVLEYLTAEFLDEMTDNKGDDEDE